VAKDSVTIHGLEKLRLKLGALPRQVRAAGIKTVRKETQDVANDMRSHAPIKTGELKAGIQEEFDEREVEGRAVSTAPHTTYVVHGTEDTPAQDFMTPAARRSQRRFRGRLTRAINEEMGKR